MVLLICSSCLFITYLDSTILNVALPTLQKDLHASIAGLQWVSDAYLLVVASLLMLTGSTADRLGRKRLFLVGLAGFSLGSLLCSLAPNTGSLIALRMVQGIGGSMLTPVSLSIVRNTFHDPKERAQALGIWSGIFGVAAACGPVVGGILVSSVGWRSIFWVNVPIGAAMIAATLRYVPESRAPRPRRVDVPGQLLMIAFLGSLTYAVIQGPVSGWTAAPILALFAVAAASLAAFIAVERRRPEPLLELRFFRSQPFTGAAVIAVLAFVVLGGFLFVITLYLQQVRGYSPLQAGLSLLPAMIVMAVAAPVAGQVTGRRGARVPLVASGLLIAAGMALLLGLEPGTSFTLVTVALVVTRGRPRPGQPADHQHRRVRHAARAGRGRVRGHLRDPPVRLGPRRRCHGRPGHHRSQLRPGARAGARGRAVGRHARPVGGGGRLRPRDRAHRLPHDHRPRARDRGGHRGRPGRRRAGVSAARAGRPGAFACTAKQSKMAPVTESVSMPRLPRPIGDAGPVILGWVGSSQKRGA